jgi:hypothetical protein
MSVAARSRRARAVTALATALLAIMLVGGQARAAEPGATAIATAASAPTLGVRSIGPMGFGSVRPRTIGYGGDPTSFVEHVHWHSWGGARAIGHGFAYWVWPGWCVACASENLHATVVAFDRTDCDGHAIYEHLEWYFPGRGMTFAKGLGPENLCTGHTPLISFHLTKCGSVTLDGGRVAKQIQTHGVRSGCAASRRFVVALHPGVYLHRSAKLVHDGWYCGSQEIKGSGRSVPQSFQCARGDTQTIEFELT